MLDQVAKGRRARSRYFTPEQIHRGFGLLILDSSDFPRADRDQIAAAIIKAYEAGAIGEDCRLASYGVCRAMQAKAATLEALRWFLQTDGKEMAAQVRQVAQIVPAVTTLSNWISL